MGKNDTKLKVGLIIAGVFIIGFFSGIGTVATFLFVKGPPVPFFGGAGPGPPPYMKRMLRDLDLTPQQHAEIEQIIRQSRDKLRKFRKEFRPEIKQIFKDTADRIRAVLNPDQQKKFDKHLKKRKKWIGF